MNLFQKLKNNKYWINTVSLKQYIKIDFFTITYFIFTILFKKNFFSINFNRILVINEVIYSADYLINSINTNNIRNIIELIIKF